MSDRPIRILCVDDHAIIREGVSLIVELQPDMEVVAAAATGEEGVELFRQTRPDITLMDLELPGINGIEATRAIVDIARDSHIIVLTMHKDSENIYRAMQAGAATYLLKETLVQDLIRVIREVHAGSHAVPDAIASSLAQRAAQPALTSREVDIVSLLARGLSNKEIGGLLGISDQTVHSHLRHIFHKLAVTDRTAAVTVALQRGIVQVK